MFYSVDDCVPRALEETPPVQVIEQYVQVIIAYIAWVDIDSKKTGL